MPWSLIDCLKRELKIAERCDLTHGCYPAYYQKMTDFLCHRHLHHIIGATVACQHSRLVLKITIVEWRRLLAHSSRPAKEPFLMHFDCEQHRHHRPYETTSLVTRHHSHGALLRGKHPCLLALDSQTPQSIS